MAEAAALLGAYGRLAVASTRARLQYRVSFVLDLIVAAAASGVDFLAILVIFSHLPALGGWSLYEVGLLYGAAGVSFAICDLTIGQLDSFSEWVRDGRFDVFLLRPLGTLVQVLSSDFAFRRVGRIGQAALVLGVSLAGLHLAWSAGRVVMLVVMLLSGVAIYSGVWIAFASVAFWTTEIREVMNAFTYGGNLLASYPINIFEDWLRRFLAFVVPMAFVAYYPALYILGKPDPLGGPGWLALLTPLVGALTLFVGGCAWRLGVRHYRSTGS